MAHTHTSHTNAIRETHLQKRSHHNDVHNRLDAVSIGVTSPFQAIIPRPQSTGQTGGSDAVFDRIELLVGSVVSRALSEARPSRRPRLILITLVFLRQSLRLSPVHHVFASDHRILRSGSVEFIAIRNHSEFGDTQSNSIWWPCESGVPVMLHSVGMAAEGELVPSLKCKPAAISLWCACIIILMN